MAVILQYKRYENESDEELIYRICSDKDKIGSWDDVAKILNELLNNEYTESKYRKQYQAFKKMFESNQSKFMEVGDQIEELNNATRELRKERQKLFDERSAYNKLIRNEARNENILDQVERIIGDNTVPSSVWNHIYKDSGEKDCDLLVHLTDVHAGCGSDNAFNVFNDDVLEDRLNKFMDKIIEVQKRHNAQNCYLVIGELISGLIHNALRIEQNENVIVQFKVVSNLICELIAKISVYFENVHIYITPGNHSRIVANIDDSLDGENFDYLFPFYAKARLQNYTNVIFHDNNFDESIAIFKIRENLVFAVHGDKESKNNIVNELTQYVGLKPQIIIKGHLHTNGLETFNDTKVIQSGTIAGTDSYAMGKRLRNRPEQTISVVTDDGLDCIYDVKF